MEKIRDRSKLIKFIIIMVSIFIVVSVAVTTLSSVYFAKLLRFVNSVQRALPTFKKAAQFYVDKNTMAEYCNSGEDGIA